MKTVHIKYCSTIEDVSFCGLELYVSYSSNQALHSLSDIFFCTFVHFSSTNQKLWPPKVYQACSKLVKNGKARKQVDVCVGVYGNEYDKVQSTYFLALI